ncbi:proteasome subunit alpha type 6, putative [Entamoeba histolytica HM-1:IMSS-B]|uniref:Proteasome subunit alpha type n=7 Tax=Entamoeba histolytica TaxID=5759 RepID=C4LSB1_ENTH1|nr:proteasome alpha subunit, putative [Entamoeba histolytica HM-1:IMSS]EMD45273.1 proteasome alpha subunit, putative [Entamoeba histolytica KU27]EMH74415.1 proteasome subunit alpha type 6, putative [Entamoeba histolytica HM-1:IMSS-B]EMS17370.1 proteasome alpha subunit, putative [Entamoeba histolytica HM-3:IMSS]ENY63985.1 proteasome alpha subunit, putative [Entamoeba histolytica HM-1:IMSS-A]BAN37512.1 proteasome subunit alpha type 6, putative [Entamoeba histolytica]|eukprot:XP_656396.1 proteasome alpha subunit, putative [Entamoeba histolytica HM-1:IMSS]
MAGTGYDRQLTIFSPEGRLYQVEYALKATKCESLTTVGVCSDEAACIITQKKLPDRLVDPSTVTHLHRISKHVGCCMSGIYADGKVIAQRSQYYASKFQLDYGYEMPVSLVAKKTADFAQMLTQHAYMRPFGVSSMFIGWDEVSGPQLWRSDPAGSVAAFRGCAAGEKEQEAFNNLEKKKITKELTVDQVVCQALDCLQTVTSSEFKATDIEIAIVTKDNKLFHLLSQQEIEHYLVLASEKD